MDATVMQLVAEAIKDQSRRDWLVSRKPDHCAMAIVPGVIFGKAEKLWGVATSDSPAAQQPNKFLDLSAYADMKGPKGKPYRAYTVSRRNWTTGSSPFMPTSPITEALDALNAPLRGAKASTDDVFNPDADTFQPGGSATPAAASSTPAIDAEIEKRAKALFEAEKAKFMAANK